MVGIFDPACELLPPWTKELHLSTVSPLPSLLPPPPPPPNQMYSIDRQCVAVGGGVGGGIELCCRPYSAGALHSVTD
jgi:hypothetical protein